ncbi:hypothetical protein F8M41_014072 [Gigaspora margarita]|uniref:Uncharacterized protein n=1 Tax=Gigaspora margarita TaxID=4874 RepID=A0A8H3WXK4_GIGMA|nr:hypothetical protein F8M41_014072 [Gigaspora margarita]
MRILYLSAKPGSHAKPTKNSKFPSTCIQTRPYLKSIPPTCFQNPRPRNLTKQQNGSQRNFTCYSNSSMTPPQSSPRPRNQALIVPFQKKKIQKQKEIKHILIPKSQPLSEAYSEHQAPKLTKQDQPTKQDPMAIGKTYKARQKKVRK